MKGNTGKYWTKAWSLIDGCTHAGSIGCDHCWSMSMNKRFGKWPEIVTPRPDRLDIPLKTKKPTVFAVWNDLWHEEISLEFINSVYMRMWGSDHIFLVLTKRAQRLAQNAPQFPSDPINVWPGVTVCNQQEADEKIPQLLQVPGHRWISIEPMLGRINLRQIGTEGNYYDCLMGERYITDSGPFSFDNCGNKPKINAIVVGCETGPHRRPCNLDWIRSIVEQCRTAGVPCFVKAININGRVVNDMAEFPEDLKIRQLPWRTKEEDSCNR